MRGVAASACLAAAMWLPLALPATARAKPDYAQQCQNEIRPKGYYRYDGSASLPVVTPDLGGTQAGADALNACIRAKAAGGRRATPAPRAGTMPSADVPVAEDAQGPAYTKRKRGASVLSGGSGYRGSYLEGGTGRGAAATAGTVAAPRLARKARRGLTPPPAGYALLPGDEALWYSLTPAQQQRALDFLKDGSTIRSSLEAD